MKTTVARSGKHQHPQPWGRNPCSRSLPLCCFRDTFTGVQLQSFPVSWLMGSWVGREGSCCCVVGQSYLQLLRNKSGVATLCSVTAETGFLLGSFGPGSSRAERALCYRQLGYTRKLHFYVILIEPSVQHGDTTKCAVYDCA